MRNFAQNHVQTNKRSKVTATRINLFLLGMILLFGLIYVFSINAIATTNFKIKKLAVEISELEAKHKELQLTNSTLQSVSTIQEQTSHLNFVPSGDVTYLKDDSFALR